MINSRARFLLSMTGAALLLSGCATQQTKVSGPSGTAATAA
jgi:hypothetical protein